MNKWKRLFTVGVAAAVAAAMLAGCSAGSVSEGASGQQSSRDSGKQIPLRFAAQDNAANAQAIQKFIEGFEAENKDIKVTYEPLTGDYSTKLLGQASSGALPDVFMNLDVLAGFFASKKVTVDVTPYFSKFNIEKTDFVPSMLKLGEFNGEQHMLPVEYSHVVTYYNKKLFDQAGISYPKNGWTWSEFTATAQKLVKKENGKITQYGCDAQMRWDATLIPLITGLGGSFVSTGGKTVDINNSNTILTLKQLKSLADSGAIVNNFILGMPDFLSQRVAMYFSVRPQAATVNATLGAGNWDVVTFPVLPSKHVVGSGCSGYSMSSSSAYPEEAAKLLFYTSSDAGQNILMQTGNSVPARISLQSSKVWRDAPVSTINQDAFILYPEADIIPMANQLADTSKGNKVLNMLAASMEKLFLSTAPDYETALKDCQTRINNELK